MESHKVRVEVPQILKGKLEFGNIGQIRSLRELNHELDRKYKVFEYERTLSYSDSGTVIAGDKEEAEELLLSKDVGQLGVDFTVEVSDVWELEEVEVQVELVW